jgi:hypothetical protein
MLISPPASRVRTSLTLLFWFVLLALAAERAGYAGAYDARASLGSVAAQLALASPAVAYLGALWKLRSLADRVAEGEGFAKAGANALRWSGVLLMLGAALALLVIPLLSRWTALGRARQIDLDVSTLIIGAIGLALLLIARLLDQARAVQSELNEFF